MAEKFNWNKQTPAQKDSILNKVVRPYLDENWEKMGFIKKVAARNALKEAGKEISAKNKSKADSTRAVKEILRQKGRAQ